MKKKIFLLLPIILLVSLFVVYYGNSVFIYLENAEPSQSLGTMKDGSLINGKRLPSKGKNYVAYSYLGALLGRNCVHSTVRNIILEAYEEMHDKFPEKSFVYGETGWCGGGRIRPHVTHRNGRSVDFLVPVLDAENTSQQLPTSIFNKFGYAYEFDSSGKNDEYRIDFEAMSAHLFYLNEASKRYSAEMEVVIFDSQLQPMLLNTEHGQKIKNSIRLSTLPAWVRHDEHYHIDFKLQ